jgi:hypothetical protein
MGEHLRMMELAALLELMIGRLQQPRFAHLDGTGDLVLDLSRLHGDVIGEIGAATRDRERTGC